MIATTISKEMYAYSKLKRRYEERIKVSECFMQDVMQHSKVVTIKKNDYLSEAGKKQDCVFFIAKGCLSMSIITEEGEEKVVGLYAENNIDIVVCPDSFAFNRISDYQLRAREDSIIVIYPKAFQDELLSKYPEFVKFCNEETGYMYSVNLEIHDHMISYSKKNFLDFLQKNSSYIFQKFPEKDIASFMGITPEWLSKLFRKIS